ncbi:MAG: CPBP family intramembrane metalloprotease [Anaerolineae bacterium]|nr:CPBP family intramembrane metalloprotease [Anaerolineae bacterium]
MMLSQEIFSFFAASLQSFPFMILAILSYLGMRREWARILAWIWLALLVLSIAVSVIGMGFVGLMRPQVLANPNMANPGNLLQSGWQLRALVILFGTGTAILLGILCLFPVVRVWVSRFIPIAPQSSVHTNALVTVVTLTVLFAVPLLALGQPPLLQMASAMPASTFDRVDQGASLRGTLYTLIWTVPCTIFSVGWLIERNWQQALQRLGFVKPTLRQIAIGIGAAVVMVIAVRVLSVGIEALWGAMGWQKTNAEVFSKLIAFALTPIGALVVAVTAGLGEELAVRGVLQPKLGLLLSNLFFTSLHAVQYNFDALLVVFVIGMAMGVLRRRTNTSTSAIAHGVYDLILLLLAGLGVDRT